MLTSPRLVGRDYVADVPCDPAGLAEDPNSKKRVCEVELFLNLRKFDVGCCQCATLTSYGTRLLIKNVFTTGSPAVQGGRLVGKYTGKYKVALQH